MWRRSLGSRYAVFSLRANVRVVHCLVLMWRQQVEVGNRWCSVLEQTLGLGGTRIPGRGITFFSCRCGGSRLQWLIVAVGFEQMWALGLCIAEGG